MFIAQDVFGSKVQSDPVDFIVIPTVFSVNAPDQTSLGSGDKGILFDGTGIPGRAVTAYIDSNPANSTVVKDDSTWELLIPSNRIIGAVTPQFTMGVGTPIDGSTISDGSGDGDGLPLGLIGGLVLLIAILVATGARFIEFGEEEGIQDDDQTEGQRYVKDPDNPGWLWDVEAGEWVIEDKN